MNPIPLTIQTLYQDLLQAHLDRAPDEMAGAPHRRLIDGKGHWYAIVRLGDGLGQHYIGPDTKVTRNRIEKWRDAQSDAKEFRALASEKAAALRAARLPALDMTTGKVLRALAQAGAFRLGAVLVGTHAFRLYDLETGVRLTSKTSAATADVDLAAFEKLSLSIEDRAEPALPVVLKAVGLTPIESLDRGKPTRWRMPKSDFVIDFIAPSFDEKERPQKLDALGLWAQGLHFLNYLIRDPIPAVALYREGVLVQFPKPERFAIHKLIVASRRRGPGQAKSEKDIAQSRALIETLSDSRPAELKAAYKEARAEGPAWRTAIDATLKRAPDIAKMLRKLE
ncbi:MAG: GSU2403 family nucleotidyltransferase fold protein [Parvularculaceae bacterium]|nr:GSU2403 family nucleotidyltransferase fold protein [Parvularculaceae bacterium]